MKILCPFCGEEATVFDTLYAECPLCSWAWEITFTEKLTAKYRMKLKDEIPLNRPTSPGEDVKQVRDEGSPQVTKVVWKTWKCDWDLALAGWFNKTFRRKG